MQWVKRIGLGLLAFVVAVVVLVYGGSEYEIRRDRGMPLGTVVPDRSPEGLKEGARLARINGCYSCHGAKGEGNVMVDIPPVITITAPPLSIVQASSDAELARTLRHAVGRRDNALWIMPAHRRVADSDLAMLMGHLRTLQATPADIGRKRGFGPVGRALMLIGKVEPSTREGGEPPAHRPTDLGPYLVDTICLGCHKMNEPQPFAGDEKQIAPPLAAMGAAYDDAAFVKLLRTGASPTSADIGEMSFAAKSAFRYLRDDEIAAIHAYLRKKAGELPPG